MTQINPYNPPLPSGIASNDANGQLSTSLAPRIFSLRDKGRSVDELRTHFTQFVGETFYGQMIKAMRSTLDKPAYFHGGRGEEVFQGQLDQQLAQAMTAASADTFAEPMFRQQFPNLAKTPPANDLNQLAQLRSR